MIARAPALGWGALITAGIAAAMARPGWQLGFAVLAIGGLGLAHGASDVAVVEPHRRPAFLVGYLGVGAACLLWWTTSPALALPLFLLASAVHFGLEDAPADRPVERIARGALMIAGPALFHRAAYADILAAAGGDERLAAMLADGMAITGLSALVVVVPLAVRRRDLLLLGGAAALVAAPPLVGFSLGFLLLHAGPQTAERMARLGCPDLPAYLRRVAPVLAGAALVSVLAGRLFLAADATGLRTLFAALAALAMPHMLVTPVFERHPAAADRRARPA